MTPPGVRHFQSSSGLQSDCVKWQLRRQLQTWGILLSGWNLVIICLFVNETRFLSHIHLSIHSLGSCSWLVCTSYSISTHHLHLQPWQSLAQRSVPCHLLSYSDSPKSYKHFENAPSLCSRQIRLYAQCLIGAVDSVAGEQTIQFVAATEHGQRSPEFTNTSHEKSIETNDSRIDW